MEDFISRFTTFISFFFFARLQIYRDISCEINEDFRDVCVIEDTSPNCDSFSDAIKTSASSSTFKYTRISDEHLFHFLYLSDFL